MCTIDENCDVTDAQLTGHDTRIELFFTTDRSSLAYLLVGILKAVAMKLYRTQIVITIEPNVDDNVYK